MDAFNPEPQGKVLPSTKFIINIFFVVGALIVLAGLCLVCLGSLSPDSVTVMSDADLITDPYSKSTILILFSVITILTGGIFITVGLVIRSFVYKKKSMCKMLGLFTCIFGASFVFMAILIEFSNSSTDFWTLGNVCFGGSGTFLILMGIFFALFGRDANLQIPRQ